MQLEHLEVLGSHNAETWHTRFKYDHTSMGDECNCPMISAFFGTTLLGDWDED